MLQFHTKNEKDDKEEIQLGEDQFLVKSRTQTMPNNITLRGVEGIRRVFMMERPKTTLLKNLEFFWGRVTRSLNGQ